MYRTPRDEGLSVCRDEGFTVLARRPSSMRSIDRDLVNDGNGV